MIERSESPGFDDLHDATLTGLVLHWSEGRVVIGLKLGAPWKGFWRIEASGVSHLLCPRAHPWGPSVSVNEANLRNDSPPGRCTLEIEVQSGDTIVLEAEVICIAQGKPPGFE